MYRVSDLLSKPLITLADAQFVGTVGNIYFDAKLRRGKYIEVFNEDEPEPIYVELKQVRLGPDAAVIVHNASEDVRLPDGLACNPINAQAFNTEGKALGRVTDVLLEGVNVVGFEVGGATVPTDTLLSYSPDMMLINDTGKPVKVTKPKPKPKATASAPAAEQPAPQAEPQVALPEKLRSGPDNPPPQPTVYNFLIGKTTTAPLHDAVGRVAVPQGTVVTPEVIERARSQNLLVRLALHAK